MADLALFDTRNMLAALEQMKPPRSFLKDTFFGGEQNQSHTDSVDIDIKKGARRLAPYVRPVSQGVVVSRIGFKAYSYKPPYIKPKMVTTAQDFLKRGFGETIYSSNDSPMQRAEKQVGSDLMELNEQITRREEQQASQLLQTGKVTVNGEGYTDYEIDFGIPATHLVTLTGTDLWTNAASTPLQDLKTWKRLIAKDSGLVPTDIIMGSSALDAFLAHASVTDALDTRRIDLGLIAPESEVEGVIFYGRLKEVGCDLWSYEEYHYDQATNTDVPVVDANKVLMGSRRARCSVNYAAIQDLKANAAVPRFPKSWEKEDPSVRFILLQSAPLLALNQVDAFICGTVTA